MDEAYQVILAWLDKEFPSGAYLSEHWSMHRCLIALTTLSAGKD